MMYKNHTEYDTMVQAMTHAKHMENQRQAVAAAKAELKYAAWAENFQRIVEDNYDGDYDAYFQKQHAKKELRHNERLHEQAGGWMQRTYKGNCRKVADFRTMWRLPRLPSFCPWAHGEYVTIPYVPRSYTPLPKPDEEGSTVSSSNAHRRPVTNKKIHVLSQPGLDYSQFQTLDSSMVHQAITGQDFPPLSAAAVSETKPGDFNWAREMELEEEA